MRPSWFCLFQLPRETLLFVCSSHSCGPSALPCRGRETIPTKSGPAIPGRQGPSAPRRPLTGSRQHYPVFLHVAHPLLGERGPDGIAGQVLHGSLFSGIYPWTGEDIRVHCEKMRMLFAGSTSAAE